MEQVHFLIMNSFAWLAWFQSSLTHHHITNTSTSVSIPGVIPGGSNLKFCDESRATDLFNITRLGVHPTPPLVEENIDIYIYGMFLSDISDDPIWHWYVRETNSDSPGENGTLAFCDTMETIEQPGQRGCPPKKGFAIISIEAFMPWLVGTGNITVKFDAKTKEGERIYCLNGEFELDYPHDTKIQASKPTTTMNCSSFGTGSCKA